MKGVRTAKHKTHFDLSEFQSAVACGRYGARLLSKDPNGVTCLACITMMRRYSAYRIPMFGGGSFNDAHRRSIFSSLVFAETQGCEWRRA